MRYVILIIICLMLGGAAEAYGASQPYTATQTVNAAESTLTPRSRPSKRARVEAVLARCTA